MNDDRPLWQHETELSRERAMEEIEADIQAMSMVGLLKLEGLLPKDFKIRTASAYQSEMWRIGYGCALIKFHKLIEVAKKEEK